jgi:toluene monooxygenase system ferredoxin subunit
MAFEPVMRLDELWSGEMTGHSVRGQRVLLINVDGSIHAYADACPHMRTPLSNGALEGRVLTCATHGWVFDVTSGKGINPARACLTEYPVLVEGNDILIDVEHSPPPQPTLWSPGNRA